MRDDVVIVGGGIGGLTAALAMHRIGRSVQLFETVERVEALGVGINLLPHAVRELDELGVFGPVAQVGLQPTRLGYFTKRGERIWDEARGLDAGYRWPQVSVHRGELQQVLWNEVVRRIGADRIHTGYHLQRVDPDADGVTATFVDRRTGNELGTVRGKVLVAADGIHSQARRQWFPDEGPPLWNGAKLWRGLAEAPRMLDGRTMVWAGHRNQKFIAYSLKDLPGDRQLINFIAELRFDGEELAEREDWNKPGVLADFLPQFVDWSFDWLDVPALIQAAAGTYLFPMIDRDPLPRWTHGRATLLGDAAHPMYPIGSNGASQAILDAMTLAGCLRCHPDDPAAALAVYDEHRRPATAAIVLANRAGGPEIPMQIVEDRAPDGGFGEMGEVISPAEIDEVTQDYRRTAGFAVTSLNERPSLTDMDY